MPDETRAHPGSSDAPGGPAKLAAALAPLAVAAAGLIAAMVGLATGAAWAPPAILGVGIAVLAGMVSAGVLVALNGTAVAWPLAFVAAQALRNGVLVVAGVGMYFAFKPEPAAAYIASALVLALGGLIAETALAYRAAGAKGPLSEPQGPQTVVQGADAA